jgi:nitroreductase
MAMAIIASKQNQTKGDATKAMTFDTTKNMLKNSVNVLAKRVIFTLKTKSKRMNFLQLIRERYSVRAFRPEPVSDVLLKQVVEAGRLAPSACNNQPWYFIIINNPDVVSKIHDAYPRDWFAKTNQIIAVCGDRDRSWKRSYDAKDHLDIDVAIAVDHMTLFAAELGLGTCWVCHFDPAKVSKALALPSHVEPIALLPIGYPQVMDTPSKNRKDIDEIVFYNTFGHK